MMVRSRCGRVPCVRVLAPEASSLKNITVGADGRLLDAARERARLEKTTLDEQFRRRLAGYAAGRLRRYDESIPSLRGKFRVGRSLTEQGRDE